MIGENIGLFEWLVWVDIQRSRVHLLIGSRVIDVVDLLAGDAFSLFADALVERIVACWYIDGIAYSAIDPATGDCNVNHYLIGTLIADSPVVDLDAASAPVGGDHHGVRELACNAALVVGWHVRLTQAAGDCGIDCMCVLC